MIQCIDLFKSYKAHGGQKHVLSNVNLTFAPGDHVGLLGRNGAGKTTLLKLLGGVEIPTQGKVRRTMSCSWPLGFAGGFQGSLTGLDNMRFISRIYGQPYDYVKTYVEEFTELGRSLAQPVKTYSSGMRARLAFALSLVIEFDCYLIDEVIMVGDQNFQNKCHTEFFQKRADRTLIIASHSTEVIREYCKTAIVVRDQQAYYHDDIDEAIAIYGSL